MSFSPDARAACIAAGELMNVSAAELTSPLRGSPAVATTRQIAMWLMYEWRRPDSWVELGKAFGRDRTTVRHGVNTVSDRMNADDKLARDIRGALTSLRRG